MAIRPVRQQPVPGSSYATFKAAFPAFVQDVHRLRAVRDREFRKLKLMSRRDQHGRVRKLLNSSPLHILYAFEALRKARRLADATPDTVAALAARCNPLMRCDEPVAPLWVPGRGRRRLVLSYGPAKRMQQLLIADLLFHLHPPLEQQYLLRGGMPAACKAVEAAFADGFTYGVEIDFVDFYGSVRFDGLAELLRPLPRRAVEHVVWSEPQRVYGEGDAAIPSWALSLPSRALRGLALGSACSPMVGERILAGLISSTDDCRMVAYADNILVLGKSPDAVQESFQEMQRRASSLVGGGLEPKMDGEGVKSLESEPFQFLHHEVRFQAGEFIWAPDQRKLGDFLAAEADGYLSNTAIDVAEARVSHWRRSYPNWPEGDLWEIQQLAGLAARRFYNEASPINRTKAADALIASYFAGGRLQSIEELAPAGMISRDEARRSEIVATAERRLVLLARRAGVRRGAIRPLDGSVAA